MSTKSKSIVVAMVSLWVLFTSNPIWSAATSVKPTTSQPSPDLIAVKQTEMLSTIVRVATCRGIGSGTLIDCEESQKGIFTYLILTNAHVIANRILTILIGADSLRGIPRKTVIDYGISIVAFDVDNNVLTTGFATVIVECDYPDLALLTFETTAELPTVNLPSSKMLDQIRVFDEIYAVGCQLGRPPLPTNGIISAIVGANDGYLTYTSNAQIAGGSSGGGLFKEYNGHYYLIGIPFQVPRAYNGQFLPHLSSAISLVSAKDFIRSHTKINFDGE